MVVRTSAVTVIALIEFASFSIEFEKTWTTFMVAHGQHSI